MKPTLWKGQPLKGEWQVTRKIDGIRCVIKNGVVASYEGKPLHGIPSMPDGDYEVYCDGGFDETFKILRTRHPVRFVRSDEMYDLHTDPRLFCGLIIDPTPDNVRSLLQGALDRGDEGLVLRQGNKWLKIKKFETHDVRVISKIEGVGKYTGKLGALLTDRGKVGTGFTDTQRREFWEGEVSDIIEVSCMELTAKGMFRHPRFKRERIDK